MCEENGLHAIEKVSTTLCECLCSQIREGQRLNTLHCCGCKEDAELKLQMQSRSLLPSREDATRETTSSKSIIELPQTSSYHFSTPLTPFDTLILSQQLHRCIRSPFIRSSLALSGRSSVTDAQ